jgi:hypothetical protein
MCESDDGQDDLMSRSTGMCENDDGQDDLMSRSTGMCENDQARSGMHPVVAKAAPTVLIVTKLD